MRRGGLVLESGVSAPTGDVLAVDDLTIRFDGHGVDLVDGASFNLGRGETLCLVGESGCGKSITALAVMGLLARHGKDGHSTIRTRIVATTRRNVLQPIVRAEVESGSSVYTDANYSYEGLSRDFVHGVIDHAEKYVDGQIHTNGCENFWSLLKRALKGTYVSVEPFHLFRYLDEQAFRFNKRKGSDAMRFALALKGIINRRLTYAALTGSELPQTC